MLEHLYADADFRYEVSAALQDAIHAASLAPLTIINDEEEGDEPERAAEG